MTITSALNAALSGLTVSARRAEVVSSNISNASTPGYARREAVLSSGLIGGLLPGVKVDGVTRNQDMFLIGQRRESQAGLAGARTTAEFYSGMETAIGLPGDFGSLNDRLARFEGAMIEAASRPDSEARLLSVASTAKSVTDHLNNLSSRIQDDRLRADGEIARAVDTLNTSLQQVVELNTKIIQFRSSTRDASALIDARQTLIDSIAEIVPIKQIERPNGIVALYTPGGGALVDSKAAEFGFTALPEMTVHRTLAGGGLSGLTINGQSIDTNGKSGVVAGGKLAALFEVRDALGPQMQTELDAVARNLIERFQDPAVDPTLGVGDPGLFTDNGLALDLAEEVGLSERISINALVDPDQGGDLWRLRNGIGAAAVGDPGDATILNAMSAVMADPRTPGSGSFTSARGMVGLAGDLLSLAATSAFQAEARVSFAQATTNALLNAELQDGVDTDQEMQELLLIEQSYAANAQVLSTLDEMMQQLLRL